ncbi:MAG: hypothetical protein AB7G75_08285 [Candidatus Binatia bacterium]
MFPHALSFGVPTFILDMTADFTPLFVGMVILLSLCVLALAVTIAVHDTREAQQKVDVPPADPHSLPRAA